MITWLWIGAAAAALVTFFVVIDFGIAEMKIWWRRRKTRRPR